MTQITTIIPAYNSGSTIGATLKSIVAQTLPSDEIIVIDDGSTDNTGDIVKQYPSVTYLRQKNAGVSMARNVGAENATCDWLAFCDADDVWHPAKLEVVVQCIEKITQLQFFFHDFYLFENSGEKLSTPSESIFPVFQENNITMGWILPERQRIKLVRGMENWAAASIYIGNAFEWLVLGNFVLPSSVVINRNEFRRQGGFDPSFRSAEETEFFLRISKSIDFAYINLPLSGYRKVAGGLTKNVARLLGNGMAALMKNAYDDSAFYQKYKSRVDLGIGRRYARIGYLLLTEFDRRNAWKNAVKALRFCPFDKKAWLILIASVLPVPLLKSLANLKKYIEHT